MKLNFLMNHRGTETAEERKGGSHESFRTAIAVGKGLRTFIFLQDEDSWLQIDGETLDS